MNYENTATMLKALADPNRLKIIDILSCGTQCACNILEHFDFTQPALSHHMKVLENGGVVTVEKKGTWNYYTLCEDFIANFQSLCETLFKQEESACTCNQINIKESETILS